MRKIITVLVAVATLAVGMCGAAFAQTNAEILSVNEDTNFNTNISYSGTTLDLSVYDPLGTAADPYTGVSGVYPVVVNFSQLSETGYSAATGESFTGGDFTVMSGTTLLLSGNFSGATLTTQTIPTNGQVALQGLTLTGGSWVPLGADVGNYLGLNSGAIQFNTTGASTIKQDAGGTGFNSFTGHDDFEVLTVVTPEPQSWASFGVGAFGIAALVLAARRRRATSRPR